jgi:hypothetical protein
MLKDKNALLINELKKIIVKYGNNTKVRNIISKEFSDRNMLSSHAIKILTGIQSLETLDIENQKDLFLLFIFTVSMQKALSTHDEVLNDTLGTFEEYSCIEVKNYFTEIEVETFNEIKLEKKEVSKYPYVFKNMLKVDDNHYTGIISAQYLGEIDAANDIIYNFKNQRDPKIDVFGMKRINIDKDKIKEIADNLLSGKQFPDEIKLNVLKDNESQFEFKSRDGTIGDIIVHKGIINIFDGYHRKTANNIALQINPDLNFSWKVAITYFSEIKAQAYMVQIDKQKPIDKKHTQIMDKTQNKNVVVDEIIDNSKSELAEQIRDNDAELKFGGLTTKSILSLAISEQYSEYLKSKVQIKEIADWIVDFTNYLMGIYDNEFIFNIQETKKDSYINHKNMFFGYIALSKNLYQQEDWKDKLKNVISSIDFLKGNEYWNNIKFGDGELSKSTRNDLYKLFNK